MKIEEVHFNHDTTSANADAFNIRHNASGWPIKAPEWKDGQPSKPAAYARYELGTRVGIKARVTGGPPNGHVKIRAIDPWTPPANTGGCIGWLLVLLAKLLRGLFGNVLGEVKEKNVAFDASGDSGVEEFSLRGHKLAVTPVGIRHTTWTWQAKIEGSWVNIGSTQHKIYVVLEVPNEPWEQSGFGANNDQLPWVDALNKTCTWAFGANTLDEVAEKITIAVNTRPNASYTPVTMFGSSRYNLTGYINALDSPASFVMNCRDCANAVTTFANLAGTDLHEGVFSDLNTRPFLTLSGNPANAGDWVTWAWGWHEIAWLNANMGPDELIYDGCLRVDVDNDYNDAVHVAQHPIKMKFGNTNDGTSYRYRLIESGTGTPSPPTWRRDVV